MPPRVTMRIMLVEQVVFALEVNQTIRIVHPIHFWREMKLRSVLLLVEFRSFTVVAQALESRTAFRRIGEDEMVDVDVPKALGGPIVDSNVNLLIFESGYIPAVLAQLFLVAARRCSHDLVVVQ